MTVRSASVALGLAFLAAGAAQGACDMPGAIPLDPPPPAAIALAADLAGMTAADMATLPGDIWVSVFTTGSGTSFGCIEADTPATCSNGIVVCAHAITSTDFRRIYLETATHSLTVANDASTPFPPIFSTYQSNRGPVRQKYVFDGAAYKLAEGG